MNGRNDWSPQKTIARRCRRRPGPFVVVDVYNSGYGGRPTGLAQSYRIAATDDSPSSTDIIDDPVKLCSDDRRVRRMSEWPWTGVGRTSRRCVRACTAFTWYYIVILQSCTSVQADRSVILYNNNNSSRPTRDNGGGGGDDSARRPGPARCSPAAAAARRATARAAQQQQLSSSSSSSYHRSPWLITGAVISNHHTAYRERSTTACAESVHVYTRRAWGHETHETHR